MTTITPKSPYDSGTLLAALCVWRESRGESQAAKNGVVWVLRNRNAIAPREGFKPMMDEEILRKWQFSSFNSDDPNCEKYPVEGDPSWTESLRAVQSDLPDETGGAVFYFSRPRVSPPKAWGNVEVSAVIGHLTFCRVNPPAAVT